MTIYNREDSKTALPQLEKMIQAISSKVSNIRTDLNNVGWYESHYDTSSLANGTSFAKITGSDIQLTAGRYIITGSAKFAGNATGYRGITIQDSNGAITRANVTQQTLPSSSWTTSLNTTIFLNVASSTTVSLMAYQNSGGALNADWSIYATRIS